MKHSFIIFSDVRDVLGSVGHSVCVIIVCFFLVDIQDSLVMLLYIYKYYDCGLSDRLFMSVTIYSLIGYHTFFAGVCFVMCVIISILVFGLKIKVVYLFECKDTNKKRFNKKSLRVFCFAVRWLFSTI